MKKILVFLGILISFTFFIVGCQTDDDQSSNDDLILKIENAANKIEFPETPIEDDIIELPSQIDDVKITWTSSNSGIIEINDYIAIINHQSIITDVNLIGNFSIENLSEVVIYTITISDNSKKIIEEMNKKIEKFSLVESTIDDIELPTQFDNMNITWKSNARSYITDQGKVNRDVKDRNVVLTATFEYLGVTVSKGYTVKVLKYTNKELLQIVSDSITLPKETNQDLVFYLYHDYDIFASWTSSNEDIITNDGKVTLPEEDTVVSITVLLTLGDDIMEKTFNLTILSKHAGKMHQVIERANEFDFNKFVNVHLNDDKLVLNEGETEGYYESNEISTMTFNELVASWAAVSSTTSTVEIMVKVKVNDNWSEYISYYPWGLGLQNKCYNQSNNLIQLVTDEVKVLNSQYANAIIFKAILKRTNTNNESPKLSLVSFALNNPSYSYNVDLSNIPNEKIYNVPKLHQNDVPVIGNSICSPTTSTMLLKYKGEDFSQYDEYEHRYIANLFKDYGNNIFGNWVYCTVGMSAYGYDAYVARMYSIDELVKYLSTGGPVGLSVKGQMTSNEKDYYTSGHLIVCVGYRYDDHGNLFILCNDPNVSNVYCEYTEEVIQKTWRNVAYIIE